MRSKFVVCLSALILLSALAVGCGTGEGLSVPIKVENADHLGAISFNLLYDSTVLKVTGVNVAALTKNSAAHWAMEAPGRLRVIVQSAKGVNGDGTLVTVKCKALNSPGSTTLVIQVLGATSAVTLEDVAAEVTGGIFTASDKSVVAPVIRFGA